MARIEAYSWIRSRYDRTAAWTAWRPSCGVKRRDRAATATLATSRRTSHSHGPGCVSSKSLTSNMRSRSGDANNPKLPRCASPASCTAMSVRGSEARSAAIGSAAPRRNSNGPAAIRPYRIGTSDGMRPCACSSSRAMGSARSGAGRHAAKVEGGTRRRAAAPAAARSARDGGRRTAPVMTSGRPTDPRRPERPRRRGRSTGRWTVARSSPLRPGPAARRRPRLRRATRTGARGRSSRVTPYASRSFCTCSSMSAITSVTPMPASSSWTTTSVSDPE